MIFESMTIEVWQALIANRLRTFLTMLGIIIGVGAVILMLAIGEGVRDSIDKMISSMGSNLLIVLSGSASSGGIRMGSGAIPTLTIPDADAISELPGVVAVSPFVNGLAQVVHGPNNWSTAIFGVSASFFNIQNWTLVSGNFFTGADVRSTNRVAVIGQTVAINLFGNEDPTGKIIRIKKSPYVVVGLLNRKGQSLDGRDQDDAIFVPVTTAQRKLFGSKFENTVKFIIVQGNSVKILNKLIDPIGALLRERHHLAKRAEDDFSVQNLTALADMAMQSAKILSLMLGAIASISLIVGGIGIMNIMLVSVTERTREIGVRAALGAKRKDILLQFLLEAVVISIAGCIIGVLFGIGTAFIICISFKINVVVSLESILASFLIAGGIGIFFGYYPARKAAYLKPIEALRYQ